MNTKRFKIAGCLLALLAWVVAPSQSNAGEDPRSLVEQLASPEGSRYATDALISMGEEALPTLESVLRSQGATPELKEQVMDILVAIGPGGVSSLTTACKARDLRPACMERLGTQAPSKGLNSLMFSALNLETEARIIALNWFARTGVNSAKVYAQVRQNFLGSDDPGTRVAAASYIAATAGPETIPELMERLRTLSVRASKSNASERQGLIIALGKLGGRDTKSASRVLSGLVQALYQADQKMVAAEALVEIGDAAVPALLMVLKRGDAEGGPAAMEALMRIGPSAAPEVVALLRETRPMMRNLAVRFLSLYRDDSILPHLAAIFRKGSREIKQDVLKIATLYSHPDAWGILESGIIDQDDSVRAVAVDMLWRSSAPQAPPLLLKVAEEDPIREIRIQAIRGLFFMGEKTAVPSFLRMLQYEKWPIRVVLLDALVWMARASDIKPVAEQLLHRSPEVARVAARVLANMTYIDDTKSPDDWTRTVETFRGRWTHGDRDTLSLKKESLSAGDEHFEALVAGSAGDPTILIVRSGAGIKDTGLLESLAPLADDFQMILVDFPGCVALAGNANPALRDCMEAQAERMELVKARFSPRNPVTVIAHSTAGYPAIWFAGKYPTSLSKLVLVDTCYPDPALMAETVHETRLQIPMRWLRELDKLNKERGNLSRSAFLEYRSRAEIASLVSGLGNAMLVDSFYSMSWFLEETFIPPGSTTLEDALASVDVPLLILKGDNDRVPAASLDGYRRLARIRGTYMVSTIPDAGHFPFISQPALFLSAIRQFVTSVNAAYRMSPLLSTVSLAYLALDSAGEGQIAWPMASGPVQVPVASLAPRPSAEDSGPKEPEAAVQPMPGDSLGVAVAPADLEGGTNLWPYVLLGVGGAFAVFGGVMNYMAIDTANSANELDFTSPDYEKRFNDEYESADFKQLIGFSSYGAAAVATGFGIYLLLTGEDSSAADRIPLVAPAFTPDGGMVMTGTLSF